MTVLIIFHALSKINGIFVAEPLRKNVSFRDRTADSEREEVFLHPVSSILSQSIIVLFKEILGLIICCVLSVYGILVVVGGQAFSNVLIIVKI